MNWKTKNKIYNWIFMLAILTLMGTGIYGVIRCGNSLVAKAKQASTEWASEVRHVQIYSETTNELIYEGNVTKFRRWVIGNGASFTDADGNSQKIAGNVIANDPGEKK